jgi:hypothetical protein
MIGGEALGDALRGGGMLRQADLTVYAQDGNLRFAVEVRAKHGASPGWVRELRHNLYLYEAIPHAPYFLLALPDFFYLWREGDDRLADIPPHYVADAAAMLGPYLGDPPLALREISQYGLETLVRSWLIDLVRGYRVPDEGRVEERWLFDSGLYRAIVHGEVATLTPV